MATLFAASESNVQVDGEVIDGVTAIEYRHNQLRQNVYALGSTERIGIISGAQSVEGRLRVASTSNKLNGLTGSAQFQIVAKLKHGGTEMTVTFDECFLLEKSFGIAVNGQGEAVYHFSAVRVREELMSSS